MINQIYSKLNSITNSFFIIGGPCIVESREVCFKIAETISKIAQKNNILYIFKASYRKANRTSVDSFTGIGDFQALEIIKETGKEFRIPTLTDIHSVAEAEQAAQYADILQIPAFLCRQTDLLEAAAKTGKTINIKKGQFLSAVSMKFVVEKMKYFGNENIILTERGNMFGYQDLVVDFRNIPVMQKYNVPVVLDITHSLQQPNQSTGFTGGRPELIETIAKAGIAAGVDGIFVETHPDPPSAKSDGANMLILNQLEDLINKLIRIKKAL
jgi:2-dehydro-3-deoxyphosphooctonate aldolase (KDO 8-P synthase)